MIAWPLYSLHSHRLQLLATRCTDPSFWWKSVCVKASEKFSESQACVWAMESWGSDEGRLLHDQAVVSPQRWTLRAAVVFLQEGLPWICWCVGVIVQAPQLYLIPAAALLHWPPISSLCLRPGLLTICNQSSLLYTSGSTESYLPNRLVSGGCFQRNWNA